MAKFQPPLIVLLLAASCQTPNITIQANPNITVDTSSNASAIAENLNELRQEIKGLDEKLRNQEGTAADAAKMAALLAKVEEQDRRLEAFAPVGWREGAKTFGFDYSYGDPLWGVHFSVGYHLTDNFGLNFGFNYEGITFEVPPLDPGPGGGAYQDDFQAKGWSLGAQYLFKSKGDSLRPYVSGSYLTGGGDNTLWAPGVDYTYSRLDARLGMYLGITQSAFLNAYVGSGISGSEENAVMFEDIYIGTNPYIGAGLVWTF